MSALLVMPGVVPEATAVAQDRRPVWRPQLLDGLPSYRDHTIALLRRYLHISMQIGRTPSPFGNIVFRGYVSSYRLQTFEDGIVFVHDVEKAINQLHPLARAIVTHTILEGYSFEEAAFFTGESRRSIVRIYGEAMDRLTSLLLQFGLLDPNVENVENLSRDVEKIQSNDPT